MQDAIISPVTDSEINEFLVKLNSLVAERNNGLNCFRVSGETGRKYTRIVVTTIHGPTEQEVSRSAYGFVDMTTGDLLKAASWKTPAKGIRGNLRRENPLNGCNPYGMDYRR